MAPRQPGLSIVNALSSALLASVAMYSVVPSSCHPRQHVSLINPVHLYFDRVQTRLERDYPRLLQWTPDKLLFRNRAECRCGPSGGDPAVSHSTA
ncbi:MAG: hypothetical protein ACREP7_14170 [Lysobacter sp.]